MPLDPHQSVVAALRSGAYIVDAGPGSGKTSTAVEWTAQILASGAIAPHRVLLLSYLNEAAEVLRTRLARYLNPATAKAVHAGTIHAHCRRWWGAAHPNDPRARLEAIIGTSRCGLTPWSVLPRLLKANGLSPQMSVDAITSASERARESGIDVYKESDELIHFIEGVLPLVHRRKAADYALAIVLYQHEKERLGVLDFCDMLYFTWNALRSGAAWTAAVTGAYDMVVLDEVQDASLIQIETIETVAANARIKALIGDVCQSLYLFRGARPDLILDRIRSGRYGVVPLRYNYRSDRRIVDLYNAWAAGRSWHRDPVAWASGIDAGPTGAPIETWDRRSTWSADLAADIQARYATSYGDVMFIARTNAQLGLAEITLARAGIPYESSASNDAGVWAGYDGRSILGYLRAADGFASIEDLTTIANRPGRFLKRETIVNAYADGSPDTTIARLAGDAHGALFAADLNDLCRFGWRERCGAVAGLLAADIEDRDKKSGLRSDEDRIELIEMLCGVAADVGGLQTLHGEIDRMAMVRRSRPVNGKVRLSTFHSAKGSEAEVVYLLVDKLPHPKSKDDDQREEEERLFYVGLSRAKRRLVLVGSDALADHPYVGMLAKSGALVVVDAPKPEPLEATPPNAQGAPFAPLPSLFAQPAVLPMPAPLSAPQATQQPASFALWDADGSALVANVIVGPNGQPPAIATCYAAHLRGRVEAALAAAAHSARAGGSFDTDRFVAVMAGQFGFVAVDNAE